MSGEGKAKQVSHSIEKLPALWLNQVGHPTKVSTMEALLKLGDFALHDALARWPLWAIMGLAR